MPATLDPATALVLIDLQHGITSLPTAHPSEQIVARCARLADAFRPSDKLVAATRVAFARDGGDVIKTRTAESPADIKPVPDYGELRAEIGLSDGDMLVAKHGWSAFYGTELDLELRRRKVTESLDRPDQPQDMLALIKQGDDLIVPDAGGVAVS